MLQTMPTPGTERAQNRQNEMMATVVATCRATYIDRSVPPTRRLRDRVIDIGGRGREMKTCTVYLKPVVNISFNFFSSLYFCIFVS